MIASYYYDAFGNILEESGNFGNPYRYAGYMYDEGSGLYNLNARFYDAKLARFMQEDTYLGDRTDPLSLNLYAYCTNNPLVYKDPTGHAGVRDTYESQGLQVIWDADNRDITVATQSGVVTANLKEGKDFYIDSNGKAQFITTGGTTGGVNKPQPTVQTLIGDKSKIGGTGGGTGGKQTGYIQGGMLVCAEEKNNVEESEKPIVGAVPLDELDRLEGQITGKKCYIYYDPNLHGEGTGKAYAEGMRSMLESKYDAEVELIAMTDFAKFQKDWGEMAEVAFVGILAHTNPSVIRLSTKYTDDGNGNRVEDDANSKRMYYGDILNLSDKNVPNVFIFGCNTAKTDAYAGDEYIARAFLEVSGVKSVVAADGFSYMKVSLFGNTRFYAGYDKDGKNGEYSAPQGYVLLTKNNDGSINRQVIFGVGKEFNMSDLYSKLKKAGIY